MSKEYDEYLKQAAFEHGVNVGSGCVLAVIVVIVGLLIWFAHKDTKASIDEIVNERYAQPSTYITLEANYTNEIDKLETLNRLTDEVKSHGFTVTKIESELSFSTVNCIRVQGKK